MLILVFGISASTIVKASFSNDCVQLFEDISGEYQVSSFCESSDGFFPALKNLGTDLPKLRQEYRFAVAGVLIGSFYLLSYLVAGVYLKQLDSNIVTIHAIYATSFSIKTKFKGFRLALGIASFYGLNLDSKSMFFSGFDFPLRKRDAYFLLHYNFILMIFLIVFITTLFLQIIRKIFFFELTTLRKLLRPFKLLTACSMLFACTSSLSGNRQALIAPIIMLIITLSGIVLFMFTQSKDGIQAYQILGNYSYMFVSCILQAFIPTDWGILSLTLLVFKFHLQLTYSKFHKQNWRQGITEQSLLALLLILIYSNADQAVQALFFSIFVAVSIYIRAYQYFVAKRLVAIAENRLIKKLSREKARNQQTVESDTERQMN